MNLNEVKRIAGIVERRGRDLSRLAADVARLEDERDALAAGLDTTKRQYAETMDRAERAEAERDALREQVASLMDERTKDAEFLQAVSDSLAREQGRSNALREQVRQMDEDCLGRLHAQDEQVRVLREALEWYGEEGRYDYDETCVWSPPRGSKGRLRGGVLEDGGQRAQSVLSATTAPKEAKSRPPSSSGDLLVGGERNGPQVLNEEADDA